MNTKINKLLFILGIAAATVLVASKTVAHDPESTDKSWWWSDAWWNEGRIENAYNYDIVVSWISYRRDGVDIPAMVVRPEGEKRFPAVLFQHGRRGLDELVQRHAKRVAARGFVVLAPDIYKAHFISSHPIEHDYALEKDVNAAVDVLLARKDINTDRVCMYSHTRGGYYALKVATTFERQGKDVACYVSYYPHLQDPNAPEPMQVYGYAEEIDDLTLPVLVFIGDEEQYQRRRVIETSIDVLKNNGQDARLVVYPGVGRGFDFRPPHVRTFADDLAARDAVRRAAVFMRKHLSSHFGRPR